MGGVLVGQGRTALFLTIFFGRGGTCLSVAARISWAIARLIGLLNAAIFDHVVRFPTIEAELILEASVLFFFGDSSDRRRTGGSISRKQINLGSRVIFLAGGAYVCAAGFAHGKPGTLVHSPES